MAEPFAKVHVNRGEGMAELCSLAGAMWLCAGRVFHAAHAGREQERAMKGIITGKDVETSALKGNTICPRTWGDGAGVGAQQLCFVCWSAVSRLVLLQGSGFGVDCQYLYLDFSGCQKTRKGLEDLSSDDWSACLSLEAMESSTCSPV